MKCEFEKLDVTEISETLRTTIYKGASVVTVTIVAGLAPFYLKAV